MAHLPPLRLNIYSLWIIIGGCSQLLAWFSALLFPQLGGNSGTRSRNWTSSWLLAAHGTDIERSRTIWARLTWTSQSCWITDGRLTLHTAAGRSNRRELRPATPTYWIKKVDAHAVKEKWNMTGLFSLTSCWIRSTDGFIGNVRFQSLKAHPEAKYDITESIDSWIRETSTRVLDLCSIA